MQKIVYQKRIDLSHRLKELTSLTIDESINYKMESQGIRALGNLLIKGEYVSDDNKVFVESVDLDILAPYQKIIEKNDFMLKVEDFQYLIEEGNLLVTIEVGVYGVKDGQDRFIEDNHDVLKEIDQLSRSMEEVVEDKSEESHQDNEDKQEDVEEIPSTKTVYQTKIREQDEQEYDVGVYYFYVIDGQDTYSTIASKYEIDENLLRDYNQSMVLEAGQVLIIPYVTKS